MLYGADPVFGITGGYYGKHNIRITPETDDRELFYCVPDKAEDYSAQFEQVFSFQVLKTEDTSEPVFFYLKSTKK